MVIACSAPDIGFVHPPFQLKWKYLLDLRGERRQQNYFLLAIIILFFSWFCLVHILDQFGLIILKSDVEYYIDTLLDLVKF